MAAEWLLLTHHGGIPQPAARSTLDELLKRKLGGGA
jgi:hypothetical protein